MKLLFGLILVGSSAYCQGPAAVPGEGLLAGLDPNQATFKEEDYLGAKAERARYPDASDFIYDFPAHEGDLISGTGGFALSITVDNKPSIRRTGAMSQEVFTLLPCGLNSAHLHGRASKVLYVLQGQINVGFVEEGTPSMARAISANLTAGQAITIPQGLAMWVHNLNCTTAQYLDTWSNSDPGTLNMVPSIMKMPVETIAAAFGVDTATAAAMVARVISAVPQGPQECLTRCNITASSPAGGPQAAQTVGVMLEPSSGSQATLTAG